MKTSHITDYHTPSPSKCEPVNALPKLTNLDFSLEENRLRTFTDWSNDVVSPRDLAHAGFYHIRRSAPNGASDMVKCFTCNAEICNWELGDVPLEEHSKWSPMCPYVLRLRGDTGRDVCGNEVYRFSHPEAGRALMMLSEIASCYGEENIRLQSYKNWPEGAKKTPKELAEAGFYYTGVGDHTVCFGCGNALKDWKEGDVAWEEHARWFPTCGFVLGKKGKDFVEGVRKKYLEKVPCETKETCCSSGGVKEGDDGILPCKICDSNERNTIFLPCNHILACEKCASQFSSCPVCRQEIQNRMRVYLS